MPRKRASAANVGDEGSAAKRVKTEPAVALVTRWEWENDGNKWTAYSEVVSKDMTAAMTAGYEIVVLQLPKGVKMKVLFERMVQKNKVTGWERRVRCCVNDSADTNGGYYIWEWEDEKGAWNPYSASVAMDLEKARAGGDTTLSFTACRRKYTIDITKLKQSNDDTGVERTVRRHKSGAVLPDPSVEVELIETSGAGSSTNGAATTSTRSSGRGATAAAAKSGAAATATTSTAKSGATKSGKSGAAKSARVKSEPGEPEVKTVLLGKGKAPVDPQCPKQTTSHVYSEGNDIYDVMLNQTNVQNNNNKFFIIQLLQDDARKAFSVWFRWGRVGLNGQNNLVACGPDLDEAKQIFCKKFADKTKNDWPDRKRFTKVAGKYDLVHIDYSVKEEDTEEEEKKVARQKSVNVPDSELDKRLQALIKLICDINTMEEAIIEMKYDAKKMPLGKLTGTQIKAGYAALKIIDKCISNNDMGSKLLHACNDFYTRIPHCFGMRTPPLIRTKEDLKAKIQMLESLAEIEIAMKIIEHGAESDMNPIDSQYQQLKCGLEALDTKHAEFDLVSRYVTNTHAPTHNQYTMKVINVFKAAKHMEDTNFNDVGNRMLLWHGSRLSNWVGILSHGLRIAPPEAPVTGYMFGKGVYFADVSSKSANYCFATRTKNTGLLLLCEVALGNTNNLLAADYKADQLPTGKDSVMGLGALGPDPKDNHTTEDGMIIPLGKLVKTGIKNPTGYTLNYNEFIVYDTRQIRMKYLVQVAFNFK